MLNTPHLLPISRNTWERRTTRVGFTSCRGGAVHAVKTKIHYTSFPRSKSVTSWRGQKSVVSVVSCRFTNSITRLVPDLLAVSLTSPQQVRSKLVTSQSTGKQRSTIRILRYFQVLKKHDILRLFWNDDSKNLKSHKKYQVCWMSRSFGLLASKIPVCYGYL